jgi:hypothetical protein
MKNSKNIIAILIALVVLGVVLRLVNLQLGVFHIVPIGAFALMAGYISKNKLNALLVPMLTMLISDIILQLTSGNGFYDISQLFVYAGMAVFPLMGGLIKSNKPIPVLGTTLGASMIFWIISNVGVFFTGMYGFSASGFVNTFIMALPFLKNDYYATLLFFNPILINTIVAPIIFMAYGLVVEKKSTKTIFA